MRIGELAARAGVNVQTIRFYERRGLLKPPKRSAASYRDYPADTLKIIQFIKRNQKSGFTLREIKGSLELLAAGSLGALNRRAGIEKKIRALDEQIRSLQMARDELAACLDACICRDGQSVCPGAKTVAEALTKR
jgi:MerR family transcriptional regulator, mercuric resistance operon regulatory protein